MKENKYLILILIILFTQNLFALDVKTNKLNTEVKINLNSKTLTSTEGINIRYGDLKLKIFEVRANQNGDIVYVPGEFYLEIDESTGKLRFDGENGEFYKNENRGNLGKNNGYLEVGVVTGAEKQNDRIYFGGDSARYVDGKVYLSKAWFTTDPRIIQSRNPLNVGYHLKSNTILIEQDKQITFKDINFYIGETDITPYTLPWFRFNIRQGSEVPLFPTFGNDNDYGWNISTGYLWGKQKSKYKGGIAPKFGDQIGFMIGRMEHWYDLEKYGEGQLNINDWLVYKKTSENKIDVKSTERRFDRWNLSYTHNYSGENGFFDLSYTNSTYNLIPALDDALDDHFAGVLNQNRNENTWEYINGIPNKGEYLEFYNLNTELKKLGKNKDIEIKADVKLVSDKEIYGVIVADKVESLGYDSSIDNDLISNISIKKENDKYSIGAYYNYLYDMDNGSDRNDLQTRAENFGFNIKDKNNKINIVYDEKNGNKFRTLNSWERDPNFSKLNNKGYYGMKFDYTPWTVEEYKIYDSRNFKSSIGEYELNNRIKYKIGYDYIENEKELNLDNDPFREIALLNGVQTTNNIRDIGYNRYENIIYNNKQENKTYVDFLYNNLKFTIAGGTTEEENFDREGMYSSDDYKIYINNSDFYEVGLAYDEINISALGQIKLIGSIRVDEYNEAYSELLNENILTEDSSTRYKFELNHDITLSENISNKIIYSMQKFSYDTDSNSIITEEIRLNNKNNSQNISDILTFDFVDKKAIYQIDFSENKRTSTDKLENEYLNQKLNLLIDDTTSLGLEYRTNKRYTDKNLNNENHNDLTFENFGTNFKYGKNEFYYKKNKIDYSIWKIKDVDDAYENVFEDVYGYTYNFDKNKLIFEFSKGENKRNEKNQEVINTNNNRYTISYLDGGAVSKRYTGSYQTYRNDGEWNDILARYDSDVITLSFQYLDSRFEDKDLVSYAASEYRKKPTELSQSEIDSIKDILANKSSSNSRKFNLTKITDDRMYLGNYKKSLTLSVSMEKNRYRYGDTENYFESLEDLETRIFYSYNRIGVGYVYNQTSGYSNYLDLNSWKNNEKEHELSFNVKLGKPSKSWRTKAYVKFYDQTDRTRSKFDGFGVEVGKEFEYYEWAVAYERDYSNLTEEYEWSTAIQFKLLTFPKINIFGLGATTNKENSTSIDPYLFDGIEIEEID